MTATKSSILVIDVGGNKVKMMMTDNDERRRFKSGKTLTPQDMCAQVLATTEDWSFDRIVIGCPGPIKDNSLGIEPVNLAQGWVGFDFAQALGKPVVVVNDAVMQAVGSHDGGKMLFLGLGTGLGAALVTDHEALPLEVAHLPYKDGATFEDFVGKRGLEKNGEKAWRRDVLDVIAQLKAALLADYVVLGGGNAKRMVDCLPDGVRLGHNRNAFKGGFKIGENSFR